MSWQLKPRFQAGETRKAAGRKSDAGGRKSEATMSQDRLQTQHVRGSAYANQPSRKATACREALTRQKKTSLHARLRRAKQRTGSKCRTPQSRGSGLSDGERPTLNVQWDPQGVYLSCERTKRLPSLSLKRAKMPQGCFCGGPSKVTPRLLNCL
jgi:hypothetical protein